MVRLLHVTTPSRELAKKKLLGEACANSFSRANRKISKHQSGTTTGMGKLIPSLLRGSTGVQPMQ
jgi:hypothetical protein